MCGIAGMWALQGCTAEGLLRVGQAMQRSLRHRGPDASGVWTDPEAGIVLAHRRLAIVDLSEAGAQPMASASGRYVLTYNGEIYNSKTIRSELENTGWTQRWRGHSDTEVLLAAIERWGLEGTLARIDGMFAFGLWDRSLRQLHLVRDRFGEKPLYYGVVGKRLIFGSELTSLRVAAPEGLGDYDPIALRSLVQSMCIPAPLSIYSGVCKLPPGTFLSLSQNDLAAGRMAEPTTYWSAEAVARNASHDPFSGTLEEASDELARLISESVREKLVADVPVGAMLSGGIDSSVICAIAQSQIGIPLRTFTIGFEDPAYDESAQAAAISRALGTQHTTMRIEEDAVLASVPEMQRVYDEPFADSSQLNTTILSRALRREVTVALSGDGGDELFGGYFRYRSAPAIWSRLRGVPVALRRVGAGAIDAAGRERVTSLFAALTGARGEGAGRISKALGLIASRSEEDIYRRLLSLWPVTSGDTAATRLTMLVERWGLSFARRMMLADTLGYMPSDILTKVDRAAMSTGLETRVPFLSPAVFEFAWSLPDAFLFDETGGKLPLRKIASKFIPRGILDRPKRGFAIPLKKWLREGLRPWAADLIEGEHLSSYGILDRKQITDAWREHLAGKADQSDRLWPILMFESWRRSQGLKELTKAA